MRLGQSLSGQANAVTHVTRPLVSVELPAGEGLGGLSTSQAYSDRRRLETAQYILQKHAAVMDRTPSLRQTYLRVAGVASARLGEFGRARPLLRRGVAGSAPGRPRATPGRGHGGAGAANAAVAVDGLSDVDAHTSTASGEQLARPSTS